MFRVDCGFGSVWFSEFAFDLFFWVLILLLGFEFVFYV